MMKNVRLARCGFTLMMCMSMIMHSAARAPLPSQVVPPKGSYCLVHSPQTASFNRYLPQATTVEGKKIIQHHAGLQEGKGPQSPKKQLFKKILVH